MKEDEERRKEQNIQPATNYMDKYTHLIGAVAAKDAAQKTQMNKQYGFGMLFNILKGRVHYSFKKKSNRRKTE